MTNNTTDIPLSCPYLKEIERCIASIQADIRQLYFLADSGNVLDIPGYLASIQNELDIVKEDISTVRKINNQLRKAVANKETNK
jgi:hypothetical protein